jgi:ATP-dependent helicase/nuclease subunit A
MSTQSFTRSQQAALAARGNVLVVAGAGTGKTHTLVERCCSLLLDEGCSLDEILMVTFTDAAAAEMRKRIRARLAEAVAQSPDARLVRRLEEQIALLDTAYISTLHSFCLRLVREHFHDERLRLDPEFAVLTGEQVHQLRNNALDALLEAHYGGGSEDARAFQKFLTEQVSGTEGKVRDLIWQLHRYSRSLADPAAWFERQLAMFGESEPRQWRRWLETGFHEWREHWLGELEVFSDTPNVADCLKALRTAGEIPSREKIGEVLAKIQEACAGKWPYGKIGAVRERIKEFFSDAAFLQSLLPGGNGEDPLAQDWEWSRGHMQTLLRLTREFGGMFDDAKREAGGVDFADLEQFALRLLWEKSGASPEPDGKPSALAAEWQARLQFVFVDEYQDINEAQDTILRAVSRSGAQANRFLVGDVKQSIYRFRLADPGIFQAYKKQWERREGKATDIRAGLAPGGPMETGQTIALSDNFRSREALLDFVNSFFTMFMRSEIGGVAYDADAHLKFGAPDQRAEFSRKATPSSHVEIHLRTKTKDDGVIAGDNNGGAEETAADFSDLDATEKEARLVALQLKKLREEKLQVWDDEARVHRAAEWRDMVVLLRSPRNKAEIFAREFNRAGVPLHVKRESFYSTTEISDLLSLLQLLDNPMQDLPLLAVLRSPLVGLSVDELAMIRAGQHDDRFWTAMLKFGATSPKFAGEAGAVAAAARPKLKAFLTSFETWRRQARQGALSNCMRAILDATHYESLLLAQDRGEERLANVNRLLRLMRQFDPYQRQGLLRFLRFVEAQRDAEAEEEPASPAMADAVRLFSIHQSKGLEFPVVAVADFGKSFNFGDLHADILLDAEFGLCPRIAPPGINGRYPSLPYWLARRRQKKELLGEELRLLYVAMTRARDRLLLVGSITEKQFEARWKRDCEITTTALLHARSYADWLGIWFAKNCAATGEGQRAGETKDCRWILHDDASLADGAVTSEAARTKAMVQLNQAETERLREKLERKYPFAAATDKAAKTSVSVLRRRATEMLQQEESVELFRPRLRTRPKIQRDSENAAAKKTGADVGTLYHRFLERVAFDRVDGVKELRAEAERMVGEGFLTVEEAGWLDFDSLLKFWRSEFGKRIVAQAPRVRRELPFTARFSAAELARESRTGQTPGEMKELENEFVVVQGVADLAVILPKEIWLLDFKTDRVTANELDAKKKAYEPQLNLYALALERIYGRPVTERRLHFLACGITVPLPAAIT